MKIKLAAIAKDESAYFPEWVFHHLYFGFDCIEVYVNNTSDNTVEVLELIKEKKAIEYKMADFIFNKNGSGNFQHQAYTMIVEQAVKDSFTHVLFLDIDEFWTPLDFKSSIKECLVALDDPDIVSFEWALKCNDEKLFSRPFSVINYITKNKHVKTIFKTSLKIDEILTHNIIVRNALYKLADGSDFINKEHHKCMVSDENKQGKLKPYLVFHRIRRSPIEYISLLGQGMRQTMFTGDITQQATGFSLKTNRGGYVKAKDNDIEVIKVKSHLIDNYNQQYEDFLDDCDLKQPLITSKQSVFSRFINVVESIPTVQKNQLKILDKALEGITLRSVIKARKKLNKGIL